MNYSIAEENYIKGIFHLQQEAETVSTNDLAAALNTRPASVTDMLKKLHAKKLLSYEKYKGVKLNATGNKVALGIIRRHRLWEFFLVNKLGFNWNDVHPIAEDLEHVSSPELIERLDQFLQFPQTDPHGDPIPDVAGKMIRIVQQSLSQVPENKTVVVSSVSNQSKDMLELLSHHQIGIGTKIKIVRRFSFDKSVEIKIQKQTALLSEQVANHLFVHHD